MFRWPTKVHKYQYTQKHIVFVFFKISLFFFFFFSNFFFLEKKKKKKKTQQQQQQQRTQGDDHSKTKRIQLNWYNCDIIYTIL